MNNDISASQTAPSRRKAMLIINPISGTGKKQGLAEAVIDRLGREGFDVDVRVTTCRGDATRLAREAAEKGYTSVIAAGGDGTVNETAKALCGTDVILGIIPSGSGNGLARHLKIPISVQHSLEVIAKGKVVSSDYGTVNDKPFFCTFGVGFDAAVSHSFAKQSRRGLITYIKSALTEYLKYKPETYTISANGKILTEKAFVIACCNASQYGNNAYISPDASITDGLLDIIIIHQGSPIDTAVVGIDLFTGYINKNTMIHSLRAPAAVIYRNSSGPAHIDGEPMILDDIMDIKCHHRALSIYVPSDENSRFRPIITPFQTTFGFMRRIFRRTKS